MKKPFLLIILLSIIGLSKAWAQGGISFSGTGRQWIENNNLNRSDTASLDKYTSGYSMVDLNFEARPGKALELVAQVRLRNEYGGFWGDGASILFRQIYLRGLVGRGFKYQIGDVNLKMTPYTFYKPNGDADINEATVFKSIRELSEYDNFSTNNTWRQQAVNGTLKLEFDKGSDSLIVDAFIGRNRINNAISVPDILQAGASANLFQSKFLQLGGNYTELYTLDRTIRDSVYFTNRVGTGTFKLQNAGKKVNVFITGEAGVSLLKFENYLNAPGARRDFFYDLGIGAKNLKSNLYIRANYREVGPNFFSAGAQTRRINYIGNPRVFPTVANRTLNRGISVYDVIREPTLYNVTIGYNLLAFNPRYGNATPYGLATPNRRGISLETGIEKANQAVNGSIYAQYLTEVVPSGAETELRNFQVYGAKGNFLLSNLLGIRKLFLIQVGYQWENTQRGGSQFERLSLTSSILDLGLDYELVSGLDFVSGYKRINSTGNEFIEVRDRYNTINDFRVFNTNQFEHIIAGGFRYRFSQFVWLTLQTQVFEQNFKDNSIPNFTINQYMLLFNAQF